jgi:hypothetical protein
MRKMVQTLYLGKCLHMLSYSLKFIYLLIMKWLQMMGDSLASQ